MQLRTNRYSLHTRHNIHYIIPSFWQMSLDYLPMVANSSELLGPISSKLRIQARVKKFYILKLLTQWIKRFLSSYKCYCDWNEVRNLVAGKRNKTGTSLTNGNKWLLALSGSWHLGRKNWYKVVSTSSWDNELSSVNQRRNKIEQTIYFIWFHTIIPTLMIFRCMKYLCRVWLKCNPPT